MTNKFDHNYLFEIIFLKFKEIKRKKVKKMFDFDDTADNN